MTTKPIIAYIDDDEDDALIFSEAFSQVGHNQFNILTFSSGEEVLHSLNEDSFRPCAFVLDMNMPKMNGLELAVALKDIREHAGTPIVVLSTGITPSESKTCEEMSIKTFKKPLVLSEWTNIITWLVEYCNQFVKTLP